MRISESRLDVLLEDIEYDVIDYLRCQIGEANDRSLKRKICNEIAEYLTSYDELDHAVVICDDSNNPPAFLESGRLQVDVNLLIDGKTFPAAFLVGPNATGEGASVGGAFKVPALRTRTLKASWTVEDEIEEVLALDVSDLGDDDTRCPCIDCQAYYAEQANFVPNIISRMADEIQKDIDAAIFKDLMIIATPAFMDKLSEVQTKKPSIYAEMPAGLASTLGL